MNYPLLNTITGRVDVSVVAPIYNEEESIAMLCERLLEVLDAMEQSFEIVLVNDGSSDNSAAALEKAAQTRPEIKVVEFRKNAGQTAAMMAGIDHARGDVVVTIDADLQNDPRDIPKLLQLLDEQDADVVSGWRKNRQDDAIKRNFVSRQANRLISWISGVKLHDYGCSLKAYRRDVLEGMRLYGEMHRFIPIYASWMGAKVIETPVRHHARQFGQSKYGLSRTFKVVLDLMVVKFFSKWLTKPIYVFGGFGIWSIFAGFATLAYALYLKFYAATSLIQTPLPTLAAMLVLVGMTSILMGLLAEIMVRTYFESQGRRAYAVRRTFNLERALP